MLKLIIQITLLWMFMTSVQANARFETFLPEQETSVVVKVEYVADTQYQHTIESIRSDKHSDTWQPVLEDYANFGYQPHPYWYRFTISNPSDKPANHMLEISYPLLDEVDLYRIHSDGAMDHVKTGDRLPYSQRVVEHPHFLFPVALNPGERNEFYLRVMTKGSQLVPLNLWQPVPLFVQLSDEDQLHAVYFGIVIVIVFFNLLIFLALREKLYFYYSASALLFMLFFAIMRAKLFPYIFPNTPEFHHFLLLILPASCLLFAALFTREFLNIPHYSKKLAQLINLIIGIALTCLAGVFLLDNQTSLEFSVLCAIPGTFALLLMGPIIAILGNPMAWVYTIAWGIFMFGATVTAMSKHGFLPVSFMTEYGMQIGSALEVFILNAALAFRFYREHEEKLVAQEARLQAHSERRDAELRLLQASMTDPVTMMPNRTSFEQAIHEILEKREGRRIAVCAIEIVRFAEISKTLGHQNTDLLMCEVAKHFNRLVADVPGIIPLQGVTGQFNLCALESGAFGFMLDADIGEANTDRINEIIRALATPIDFKEMRIELQPVTGVAVCPEHGLNASTLLRHAQVAADTSEARERYLSYYRPEQDQYNARRLMMISELKDAINEGDLELYFQPKLDLKAQKITGVEALVRWHHSRYGLVRPDDFIAIAEQTGVIRSLTRWVIKEACAAQTKLAREGLDLVMAINLSAINLREPDLYDFLRNTLNDFHLDPARIYLELTETSMMQDPLEAIATLSRIRSLGVGIAIDDFGTGYSSLAYLQDMPANEIKIDKSLVAAMNIHDQGMAVLQKTIDMCHELSFRVVAEGVENGSMLNALIDLDCDLVQGYLLTPPLPYERLLDWLAEESVSSRFAS
ncbi:MAG: EAL domain-containing protein [Oleiphilaceae bacterium]|nr:EAL domain-containing protein [Oleiphilaceae bacterium]